MRPVPAITIPMPILSTETAYELSLLLQQIAHEFEMYYSDEIRSEVQHREYEREESRKALDDLDDDPIPF